MLHIIVTGIIIPFMRDGWAVSSGSFPAMTETVAFLTMGLVRLTVSVYLLRQDVIHSSLFKTSVSDASIRSTAVSTVQNGISQSSGAGKSVVFESSV